MLEASPDSSPESLASPESELSEPPVELKTGLVRNAMSLKINAMLHSPNSGIIRNVSKLGSVGNGATGIRGAATCGVESCILTEGYGSLSSDSDVAYKQLLVRSLVLALEEAVELLVLRCLLAVWDGEGIRRVSGLLDEDLGELDGDSFEEQDA